MIPARFTTRAEIQAAADELDAAGEMMPSNDPIIDDDADHYFTMVDDLRAGKVAKARAGWDKLHPVTKQVLEEEAPNGVKFLKGVSSSRQLPNPHRRPRRFKR